VSGQHFPEQVGIRHKRFKAGYEPAGHGTYCLHYGDVQAPDPAHAVKINSHGVKTNEAIGKHATEQLISKFSSQSITLFFSFLLRCSPLPLLVPLQVDANLGVVQK